MRTTYFSKVVMPYPSDARFPSDYPHVSYAYHVCGCCDVVTVTVWYNGAVTVELLDDECRLLGRRRYKSVKVAQTVARQLALGTYKGCFVLPFYYYGY